MRAEAHAHGSGPDVLALCGGIGGAKLALGLARVLAPERLLIVANTGDDFEHLGLHVSPDLDTVLYTLAGLANPKTGWGRANETWTFMQTLAELGGETWFRLGDRDLAVHVERTRRLRSGDGLSQVTSSLAQAFGVRAGVAPMSDDPVRTSVMVEGEELPFQHYFVRMGCEPAVQGLLYRGAETARTSAAFAEALRSPALGAIVICPSNPYLSVGPILAIQGVREALKASPAPVVAVSPIIAGRAVKGPTAKIMGELGVEPSAASIAAWYGDLLDGFVLDRRDAPQASSIGMRTLATETMMKTMEDREALARVVLEFSGQLHRPPAGAVP